MFAPHQMKHLLTLLPLTISLYSCNLSEHKKVDFVDIKTICDDIDFQFKHVKFHNDSLITYKQELILINDPLETKKIINTKIKFKRSNRKEIEKLLSNDNDRNQLNDLNDLPTIIN